MQDMEPEQIKKEYYMFNRNDAYKMSKLKMCLSAYSLFPIRVLICILGVIIGIIGYSLISVMKRGWFRLKCLKVVAYLSSRLLMLSAGYIFISEEKRKPNEFLKDYKEERELGEEEVAIMIGNHVNFTDVFYMTMKYGCTFAARKDYKTIFPFNIVGKAYDAIWIDRLNDSQKKEALKEIKERVNDYLMKPCDKQKDSYFAPLLIYPEGTCSNGSAILSFKQGAFASLKPIAIVCLDYTRQPYTPFLDPEGQFTNIIFSMCQPWNTLHVITFSSFDPSYLFHSNLTQDQQIKLYSDNVKLLIARALNISQTEYGYFQNLVYSHLYYNHFQPSIQSAKDHLINKYK